MSDLPDGWTLADIGSLTSGITDGTHAPPPRERDGAPLLSAKDIVDGEVRSSQGRYVSQEYFESEQSRTGLAEHDVLLTIVGTIGRSAVVPANPNFALQRSVAILKPFGVTPKFLSFYLRSPRAFRFYSENSRGTAQQGLYLRRLRLLEVPVPPLREQLRIVAAIEEQFSRLDAADESLKRAGRRLAVLRTRVIETAFSAEWPWTTLGAVAEIVGGVTKDSKRQSDPSFVEVPYLRVANVQRGFLDLEEVATIRVAPDKARSLALRTGDVLFNEGGDRDKLGRGWVWLGQIEGCIHQNHVFRARLRDGFEPKFISWHGNTFGQRWFEEHGRQTTNLASLNLTTLKSFPVPAPPIEEQRCVVATVERQLSIADAMAAETQRALRRSAVLRRAILTQAFRGELAPQDPDDEPAAAMLERLAEQGATAPRSRPRRRVKT